MTPQDKTQLIDNLKSQIDAQVQAVKLLELLETVASDAVERDFASREAGEVWEVNGDAAVTDDEGGFLFIENGVYYCHSVICANEWVSSAKYIGKAEDVFLLRSDVEAALDRELTEVAADAVKGALEFV